MEISPKTNNGIRVLKFQSQRLENVTPELLAKSAWVTTALAMIFALPPLGVFITLYELGFGIAIAAVVGFGLHFAILVFARRISAALSKLFD